MLLDGQADIGVATEALIDTPDIVAFPYYSWHHAVIVPAGHPLEGRQLTLETLAEFPLITYNEGFTGRGKIDAAFAAAGFAPDIVMSALDADVIKSYVELGIGVGIIASMAFDAERDTGLRMLDATQPVSRATHRASPCARAATCAATPTASSSCARPS